MCAVTGRGRDCCLTGGPGRPPDLLVVTQRPREAARVRAVVRIWGGRSSSCKSLTRGDAHWATHLKSQLIQGFWEYGKHWTQLPKDETIPQIQWCWKRTLGLDRRATDKMWTQAEHDRHQKTCRDRRRQEATHTHLFCSRTCSEAGKPWRRQQWAPLLILVSNHHSPLKGTRAAWRSGWLLGWGKASKKSPGYLILKEWTRCQKIQAPDGKSPY